MKLKMLVCAITVAAIGCATTEGYPVKEVGSFHAGGKQVSLTGLAEREIRLTPSAPAMKVNPNGDFETGQIYVQYVRLAAPEARYPLLMWHGGGLTGVTWETKPDGAPGWQQYFLRQGHDVYVSDAVERGRASWSRYPEIFASEPFFRPKHEAWEGFRIGPAYHTDPARRVAHPGVPFPTDVFDQFAKQVVPRWATNNAGTQAAYDALVARVCPCVIFAHSQGTAFAFQASLNAPGKVKGIVAVEPGGARWSARSCPVGSLPCEGRAASLRLGRQLGRQRGVDPTARGTGQLPRRAADRRCHSRPAGSARPRYSRQLAHGYDGPQLGSGRRAYPGLDGDKGPDEVIRLTARPGCHCFEASG